MMGSWSSITFSFYIELLPVSLMTDETINLLVLFMQRLHWPYLFTSWGFMSSTLLCPSDPLPLACSLMKLVEHTHIEALPFHSCSSCTMLSNIYFLYHPIACISPRWRHIFFLPVVLSPPPVSPVHVLHQKFASWLAYTHHASRLWYIQLHVPVPNFSIRPYIIWKK